MTFKIVIFLAVLAYANAGLVGQIAAPVSHYSPAAAVSNAYFESSAAPIAVAHAAPVATYATAPVSVHDPHFGATSQSVIRSLGGNQAVSHYSKAVDSAFSSVRKYDSRITNDAVTVAHASPVASYSSPLVTKTYGATLASDAHAVPLSTYAHSAPVTTYSHAAPIATYSHATPVTTYSHAAPIATYSHAAPVTTYSHAAPITTYSHAAPVATYSHAAPIAAYSAPLVTKSYAAPVVSKAAVSYSPAVAVSHASFAGLGAHYEW